MLVKEIDGSMFSFLDYNGWQGAVISSLAHKYHNSTFVAMVDNDAHKAAQLYDKVKTEQLTNLVVTNLTVDHKFTSKLVESPEFFRYQYIGMFMVYFTCFVYYFAYMYTI